jgi:hypothetical protein
MRFGIDSFRFTAKTTSTLPHIKPTHQAQAPLLTIWQGLQLDTCHHANISCRLAQQSVNVDLLHIEPCTADQGQQHAAAQLGGLGRVFLYMANSSGSNSWATGGSVTLGLSTPAALHLRTKQARVAAAAVL